MRMLAGGSAGGSGGSGATFTTSNNHHSSGGTAVLTIRAKKSDIDAFAKGKLSLDEFREKATVLLY